MRRRRPHTLRSLLELLLMAVAVVAFYLVSVSFDASGVGRAEYDDDGAPLRMVGIIREISQRKQAEETQRLAEAQLRKLRRWRHRAPWLGE